MTQHETDLHKAVRAKYVDDAIAILRSRPHLVNRRDPDDGSTPLHWAAKGRHLELIDALIAAGAAVNAVDATGRTPLQWVTHHDTSRYDDRRPVIRLLMSRGAEHTFETAIRRGEAEHVAAWLRRGTPCDAPVAEQLSPLALAAEEGDSGVVRVLLESGAAPDGQPYDESTPLVRSIRGRRRDVVNMLLAAGADPECDRNGVLPLDVVTEREYGDLLLMHGARPTPQWAVFIDDPQALTRAVAAGFDVDRAGLNGRTALHVAADLERLQMVEALLQKGARVDATDRSASTPLHIIAEQPWFGGKPERRDIAKHLLAAGADPNARDERQRTPLHAALAGLRSHGVNIDIVEMLVDAGADPLARDADGLVPYECDRGELHIGPGDASHVDEVVGRRDAAVREVERILGGYAG